MTEYFICLANINLGIRKLCKFAIALKHRRTSPSQKQHFLGIVVGQFSVF